LKEAKAMDGQVMSTVERGGLYQVWGKQPDGRAYEGTVELAAEGEAFRCTWQLRVGGGATRELRGVGFFHRDGFYASRSRDLDADSTGVVVYRIMDDGRMPARWYHPDLDGKLGEGLSLDGPQDGLPGLYRAEYSAAGGDSFAPLVKELAEAGDGYTLTWRQGGQVLYRGVGLRFGPRLVAGWASPRDSIEVVCLHRPDWRDRRLSGVWTGLDQRPIRWSPEFLDPPRRPL
jgi:hypothetical protein